MQRLGVIVLMLALVSVAASSRAALEGREEKRVPASLLYLPEGPYLRATALGQEETLADLLYIWSLQYYSNYEDASRYDYLAQVFDGAITELDPRFHEAYLIGALIMSIEARRPELAMQLYDKGLANMPDNWELAYWAGWEAYNQSDYRRAFEYWKKAVAIEDAPRWIERMAARMLEKAGDSGAALEEYRRILEQTEDERTRKIIESHLRRLHAETTLQRADQAVAAYRQQFGRCPESLDRLFATGLLADESVDPSVADLRYDAASCRVLSAALSDR